MVGMMETAIYVMQGYSKPVVKVTVRAVFLSYVMQGYSKPVVKVTVRAVFLSYVFMLKSLRIFYTR